MSSKVLIFTGAPESNVLDWSSSGLLSEFQDAIAWFARINTTTPLRLAASSTPEYAVWRSLSLDKAYLPTGFSQQHAIPFGDTARDSVFGPSPEFLTPTSLTFTLTGEDGDRTLSQFYEHSMIAHQGISSSQLISQSSEQAASFLSDGTTSWSGDGTQEGPVKEPLVFRGSDLLSDLRNIPSASYLVKIQPQTMTSNLIVGIISISRPRAVKTRWGATKHLVEVLVGDETKAGFAITYWLPSDSVANSALAGLRPRDIVLMQNVALNVFANKVYGCSLSRNLTKVHLLYRLRLDSQDVQGYYSTSDLSSTGSVHPQLEKTRRVRDWVVDFVGRGSQDRNNTRTRHRWDRPPLDDTQVT
ncbi:uncharacterized protein B0T15DRAFT_274991 [Chaetomium strumarium]|uniref:Nucleic acid-binding, OB-fold protein n=1 Tax=Chaetomium strumarium TaxID=1170767 RepID=A0AAJ0LZI9_9PEZI|nr:hypothetical protein B0T15DRAFT_274991 [Chaetomium strumarium]